MHRPSTAAIGLILILATACSRDVPVAVEPTATAETVPAAADIDPPPPEALPEDPIESALSAAAGLPQSLDPPLADGVEIGFEYGTLLDAGADGGQARQVMIEPIGVSLGEAVAVLDRSLRGAGFELVESAGQNERIQRRFAQSGLQGIELALEATPYPDPESAAHPGGTGVIALRLEPAPGH